MRLNFLDLETDSESLHISIKEQDFISSVKIWVLILS